MSEGVPVSATDNYTPTTEQVRRSYWYNTSDSYSAALSDAEFDRWLAAERAKAWDEGRESLAADIASPLLDNMTKRQTKNPYRDTCRNAQGIRNATSATSLVTVHWWNGMDEAERIVRGVGNQKVGVTVDDLALDEMDGNQNAEPRWSANRLEEVLREGLPDQNAEPETGPAEWGIAWSADHIDTATSWGADEAGARHRVSKYRDYVLVKRLYGQGDDAWLLADQKGTEQ